MEWTSHVWSAYGHRFYMTGGADDGSYVCETCMTCGAEYELSPDPDRPYVGNYHASNGDEPQDCSFRTNLQHGTGAPCQAADGLPCEAYDDAGTCDHLAADHGCNCVLCSG